MKALVRLELAAGAGPIWVRPDRVTGILHAEPIVTAAGVAPRSVVQVCEPHLLPAVPGSPSSVVQAWDTHAWAVAGSADDVAAVLGLAPPRATP